MSICSNSTNTHVPAPYWSYAAPIQIPFSSCNKAADVLIDWFGPEDLKTVVGGERWWQIRGLDGIDSEWITEKVFLRDVEREKELPAAASNLRRMEHLETVMVGGSIIYIFIPLMETGDTTVIHSWW